MEAPGWQIVLAVHAIVERDGQVLMVRNRYEDGPWWSLPGGRLEDHESFADAVGRELHEETGLELVRLGALAYTVHVHVDDRRVQYLSWAFAVDEWRGSAPGGRTRDPEGVVEAVRWFDQDELADLPGWFPDPLPTWLRERRQYHYHYVRQWDALPSRPRYRIAGRP